MDTGCSLEDPLEAMDNRDRWWESGNFVLSTEVDYDAYEQNIIFFYSSKFLI